MEKIADVLAQKFPQFNTVVQNCPVSDALYQMCSENVDFLIVMDENKFKGIITDHDIASKVLFDDRPLKKVQVKEFMSQTLPVATPETSIEQCMQLMERYQVRHLAIFDSFNFKGIISSNDLMQQALKQSSAVFNKDDKNMNVNPWNY